MSLLHSTGKTTSTVLVNSRVIPVKNHKCRRGSKQSNGILTVL